MRQSVDVKVYETKELIKKLQEWGADDIDLLMAILKECGTFLVNESQYVLTIYNGICEQDPDSTLCALLRFAFNDKLIPLHECSYIKATVITVTEDTEDIIKRLGIKRKDNKEE